MKRLIPYKQTECSGIFGFLCSLYNPNWVSSTMRERRIKHRLPLIQFHLPWNASHLLYRIWATSQIMWPISNNNRSSLHGEEGAQYNELRSTWTMWFNATATMMIISFASSLIEQPLLIKLTIGINFDTSPVPEDSHTHTITFLKRMYRTVDIMGTWYLHWIIIIEGHTHTPTHIYGFQWKMTWEKFIYRRCTCRPRMI